MLDWNPQPPYTAEQLLQVIRILRDPENGCPWDKVQTHASIRKNFLEETCEALEAIDADDAVLLREELDKQYPQYQLAKHKGYPTKLHYELIAQYGIQPFYRRSFLKKQGYWPESGK